MPTRLIGALLLVCLMGIPADAKQCVASWYGGGEKLNAHTANGERFNPRGLTAAHRSLPFGTKVRVTWQGRAVVVRINDRGPHASTGRCIDLSRGAAERLGMKKAGVARVNLALVR